MRARAESVFYRLQVLTGQPWRLLDLGQPPQRRLQRPPVTRAVARPAAPYRVKDPPVQAWSPGRPQVKRVGTSHDHPGGLEQLLADPVVVVTPPAQVVRTVELDRHGLLG